MFKQKILLICFLAVCTGVTVQNCMAQGNQCTPQMVENLLEGSLDFTCRFLKESFFKSPKTNIIMSPISTFPPMGELGSRAQSNTATQLLKFLNLQNQNEIKCAFPELSTRLEGNQDVTLNMASRIFVTDSYPITQSFRDDTKNIFKAESESLNFANSEAAATRINQWVEDQTNSKIKNIFSPLSFNSATRLVLANAIYFMGNWVHQFNCNLTVDRDFHVDSKTIIQKPTMHQKNIFKYGENDSLGYKALEMFYKGGNFSFFAILPNAVDNGIANLFNNLHKPSDFFNIYDSTSTQEVEVCLPKMKIESEFNLKEVLESVGVTDLFDSSKCQLSDILQQNEPLYVSSAIQKAFIDVNEIGTEAAAANVIKVGATAAKPAPKVFQANRPFLYFILNNRRILFSGAHVS
ncbi:hypothetical protein ACJJTC_019625 [Scirpophaga incertulas]